MVRRAQDFGSHWMSLCLCLCLCREEEEEQRRRPQTFFFSVFFNPRSQPQASLTPPHIRLSVIVLDARKLLDKKAVLRVS